MEFGERCENASFATVRCHPVLGKDGHDVLVIVAKMAYRFGPRGEIALSAAPVRFEQESDGEGGARFPEDLADEKPGTDVGLSGTATPPVGQAPREMFSWLQVGGMRKVVRVFGPRVYLQGVTGLAAGPAAPLEPLPLRYAHCWGGTDATDPNQPLFELANPIGRGFARDPRSLVGQRAHQLELVPSESIGPSANPLVAHPSHAAFAPLPPHFEPRRSLAGTHDAEWARTRAPIRPRDFDVRHHSWAPNDLHSRTPLVGDEPVELGGMHALGAVRFKLPRYEPTFEAVVDGERRDLPTHLDGFFIDADECAVELTWRATIRLPRKWQRLGALRVSTTHRLPESVIEADLTQLPKAV